MKKTFKKALAIILSVMLLLPFATAALAAEEDIASGTAGDGVNWVIDADGTLTISGEGEMEVGWHNPPWYEYNASILKIVIEEGITNIPGTAFYQAKNCTDVYVPASVKTISTYANAFCYMNSLERITVDENNPNYKSIDGIVFSKDEKTLVVYPQNKNLTEYTVPDSVEEIAEFAFYYARNLKKITIPDKVTSIGDDVFAKSKMETIILGSGITEIPHSCFYFSSIKSVVIPDSVKTIAYGAFYACHSLETLVIGSGVESIGGSVIRYAEKLSAVHYNGTQEEWDAIEINADNTDDNGLLTKKIHFVEQKDGVTPTCKEGHTAGLYCSDCECYVSGEEVDAVSDHTPRTAVDENVVAAKCETAGTKDVVVYCSVCDEELSRQNVETEPAKGHSFADGSDVCVCGAKKADYSGYYAAMERYDAVVDENSDKFVDSTKEYITAEIQKIVDEYLGNAAVEDNYTEEEQYILDGIADGMNAICDTLEKGITDGTLVKPDYTEIEAKIAEFQKTHSSEEYNALVAEVIADYNAMVAKNHETAVDAADDIAAIEAKMNKTENCDHNCHKDGIMGFFWKIVNFFSKLFGSNPVCECGATHYNHASALAAFVPVKNETTLENPEFVAADNEATNVLENGD